MHSLDFIFFCFVRKLEYRFFFFFWKFHQKFLHGFKGFKIFLNKIIFKIFLNIFFFQILKVFFTSSKK